jgi:hypothetical protein
VATIPLETRSLDLFLKLTARETSPRQSEPIDPSDQGRSEVIRREIGNLLRRTHDGMLADAPFALRKPVSIAVLLGRADEEQYSILCHLCDGLRTPPDEAAIRLIAPFSETDVWGCAIALARRQMQLNAPNNVYNLNQFSRAHAVADAMRRLEERGYSIELTTFGPALDTASVTSVCRRIDRLIAEVGGRTIVDGIFRNLRQYEGSFLYGRLVDQIPQFRPPSIPQHFLYNVALKHLGSPANSGSGREAKIAALGALAQDMAAVFDVEAYSAFEGMWLSAANLHHALLDKVFFDELFAFPQWQPTVAADVYSSWLHYLAAEGGSFPYATHEEWTALGRSLIVKASLATMQVIHPAELASSAISSARTSALLARLALPVAQLNAGYLTPFDTAKRNSPYYPIYQLDDDLYLLPPRALSGRALFERLYALLRDQGDAQLENRMAKSLERLTAEAIAQMGAAPDFVGAQYRTPGQKKAEAPHEIDVVQATDRFVFLMECKKKPLTNVARGGNSLSVAIDFAQAYIEALVQMVKHEIQLREGGITFLDGRVLKLDGRTLQRIAVTMTDHGSMQDRVFLRAIVSGLWGSSLSPGDPALTKKVEKFNKPFAQLQSQIAEAARHAPEPFDRFLRILLHSSWWLSIDQLFFFCRRAPQLWNAISPLASVTFGTGDVMTEIAYCDRAGILKAQWTR